MKPQIYAVDVIRCSDNVKTSEFLIAAVSESAALEYVRRVFCTGNGSYRLGDVAVRESGR